jgi:Tfp pilus assembly protein PilE
LLRQTISPPRIRSNRFTLIELLVVIAIVGILNQGLSAAEIMEHYSPGAGF